MKNLVEWAITMMVVMVGIFFAEQAFGVGKVEAAAYATGAATIVAVAAVFVSLFFEEAHILEIVALAAVFAGIAYAAPAALPVESPFLIPAVALAVAGISIKVAKQLSLERGSVLIMLAMEAASLYWAFKLNSIKSVAVAGGGLVIVALFAKWREKRALRQVAIGEDVVP